MKVDLPLYVPGGSLSAVPDAARAAESAGFDGVSCSETTSDPLLHLTVAAGVTSRVALMTDIVVAFARSPMTLAVQGRALQDYSEGRLVLGLGSQVKPHIERRFSMPWSSPAARMTEFVLAMRTIWNSWETGEKLDFRGEFYTHTLMTPMFTPPSSFPAPKIHLAAVGERMTEAAGAVADGMLVHPFSTERYLREVTMPALARGRATHSRDLDVFDLVGSSFVVTGDNEKDLAASATRVKERIAFYGSTPAYRPVLELHGWGDLATELNRLSKTDNEAKWVTMGQLISDDVLEAFSVIGAPDQVGKVLVERYGDLITRYKVNSIGMKDQVQGVQVASSLQAASVA